MRDLIEAVTGMISWCRWALGLKVEAAQGQELKLNLGCGLAVCPGWVNIDGSLNAAISPLPEFVHRAAYALSGSNRYYTFSQYHGLLRDNRFFQANLSYGIPAHDASADFIYTSHFVEHLYLRDAEKLVEECFRVLKPRGVLRIAVPDLDHALKLLNGGNRHQALVSYFFVEDKDSSFARHKYMYDYGLLEALLSKKGFANIKRCTYREGRVPDLAVLDNRPEETLYVEAERP